MRIKLNRRKVLHILSSSLKLTVGTGYFEEFGLKLLYSEKEYEEARLKLPKNKPLLEDILMQILKDGNSITFIDVKGKGEYTEFLSLRKAFQNIPKVSLRTLLEFEEGMEDTNSASIVLQTILYEEIVFD